MTTTIINRKDDGDPIDRPPRNPTSPPRPPVPSKGNLGGSPGLVTSTGGLYGVNKFLLVPFYDSKYKNTSLQIIDSDNFDTEEDAFYYFPCPDIKPGRPVTSHKIVIVYREIGLAQFFVGIVVYIQKTDTFIFKETTVNIKNLSPLTDPVNGVFPDQKLHTTVVNFVIDGERPQIYLRRVKDSGPIAIVSVTHAGNSNVQQLL